jgi:hypothetical protein
MASAQNKLTALESELAAAIGSLDTARADQELASDALQAVLGAANTSDSAIGQAEKKREDAQRQVRRLEARIKAVKNEIRTKATAEINSLWATGAAAYGAARVRFDRLAQEDLAEAAGTVAKMVIFARSLYTGRHALYGLKGDVSDPVALSLSPADRHLVAALENLQGMFRELGINVAMPVAMDFEYQPVDTVAIRALLKLVASLDWVEPPAEAKPIGGVGRGPALPNEAYQSAESTDFRMPKSVGLPAGLN